MSSSRNRLAPLGAALFICCWLLAACSSDSDPAPADGALPGDKPEPPRAITPPVEHLTVTYGDLPSQFGTLWRPEGDGTGRVPVVVLIHGGFWRDAFDLSLMTPLSRDLFARGYAVWNIEYRRLGDDGGGWPTTFDDVAAAADHLAELADEHLLDLDRVAYVGHSAGGHLALWAAGRDKFHAGQPWSEPAVSPVLTVGQAPVNNLVLAANENASNGATQLLLGGEPQEVPERYEVATPREDLGGALVMVWGDADTNVPLAYAITGDRFADAVIQIAGADHFDVIDPTHRAWTVVVDVLDNTLTTDPA